MIEKTGSRIQAIKGMSDILPSNVYLWQKFESHWRQLMWAYGYDEIRFPIVEATGLFKRSIGEVTDIVEKEMFTFSDRDGESITLRPEGTAGCVRAGIEHGLFYHNQQRLWLMGPMFRYEKPQKGRYRQFHQVGVESFGFEGPDMEVEHILMLARFWHGLGLSEVVTLQVNTLGGRECRQSYREALIQYFSKYKSDLDEDSLRRLQTNPMRILDSKNPALSKIIHEAPKCYDYISEEDKAHFEGFQQSLIHIGIPFEVNPNIVRGLDYYNRTVYEWTTPKLGAQNAVCAGGRYDALVEQLGGERTPAVGLAVGVERVVLLLESEGKHETPEVDVYLISVGENASKSALLKAEELRDQAPGLRVLVHCGGGSFKNQFKRADKTGAKLALVLGEDELTKQVFGVKFLREEREQTWVSFDEIGQYLNEYFKGGQYVKPNIS